MEKDEEVSQEDYMKMLEANAKMDDFLDTMLQQAKSNPRPQNEQSIDEIIEELQGHPAFMKEVDLSKPLSAEMEGLIALKYETENPTARAESYKDEGNYHFKKKDYRLAVDNYTEGIKSRSPEKELNAMLYTNRAAAQFHIGNFRSALLDCVFACKFKPNHMKAIVRGATCCVEMRKFEDAISWCDTGLLLFEPENEKLVELRGKAVKGKKVKDLEARKQAAKEKKMEAEESSLLQTIKERGMKVAAMARSGWKTNALTLSSLEPHGDPSCRVHLDSSGDLVWPVLFLYPEHGETDFIQAFPDSHTLFAHIAHMFGPEVEPPPWDAEHKYKPESIRVYFEDRQTTKLHEVDVNSTLLTVLQHEKYLVYSGTPSFILLADGSKFQREFLTRHET